MSGCGNGFPGKHPYLFPVVLAILCFLGFAGLTVSFTAWAVNNSEHKWCQVLQTLKDEPAPGPVPGNPSRMYDAQLSKDFTLLERNLGCS